MLREKFPDQCGGIDRLGRFSGDCFVEPPRRASLPRMSAVLDRVEDDLGSVVTAAMRLARFNVQTTTTTASTDKRYFVGMPSPAAASVIASTVYLYPYGLQEREAAFPALAMVLVPAFLMVSTIRFRSVKTIDVGHTRSYFSLFLAAGVLALIATHPRIALVILSYTYTAGALIMWGYTKLRRRPVDHAPEDHSVPDSGGPSY